MTDVSERARGIRAQEVLAEFGCVDGFGIPLDSPRAADPPIVMVNPTAVKRAMLAFSQAERDILAGQSVGDYETASLLKGGLRIVIDYSDVQAAGRAFKSITLAATPAPDSPAIPEEPFPKWDVCRNCCDGSHAGLKCAVCDGKGHVPFKPTPASHTALTDAIDALSGIAQPSAGVLSIDQAKALGLLIGYASASHTAPDAQAEANVITELFRRYQAIGEFTVSADVVGCGRVTIAVGPDALLNKDTTNG